MQSEKDEAHQKEGHCIADLVKCAVLLWSASLLTLSYLSIVPNMKMDNTFVASLGSREKQTEITATKEKKLSQTTQQKNLTKSNEQTHSVDFYFFRASTCTINNAEFYYW